jgi:hypothetical protein
MSKGTLANVRIYSGGCDLTGVSNKVTTACECEDKETTNFASVDASGYVWKEVVAGIFSTSLSGGGQWEAGDTSKVDDAEFAALGNLGAWSALPRFAGAQSVAAPTYGDLAYLTNALAGKYDFGGGVGDVAPWSATWTGSQPFVRGYVMHPPGTARTATGTGSDVTGLGAISATQKMYVALHVLSVADAAATMVVTIESDDNSGFSSPTTRATFTGVTARGGQFTTIAGAVTDNHWRVKHTITGGSTPSFLYTVTAGVK